MNAQFVPLYSTESTTRIVNVSPIDQTQVLRPVMPEVLGIENGVRLKFTDDHEGSLSTILRTRSGYIDYTVRNIGSIPHDFVQSSLTSVEQSIVIGGQTPDIIIVNEDGTKDMIEIATRHVFTYEDARHALTEKINKYYRHIEDKRVNRMNVIVVYLGGVITLNDVLEMETVSILVEAYRMGLRVLELIKSKTTINISPDIEPMQKEINWFKGVSYPERPLGSRHSRLMLTKELRESYSAEVGFSLTIMPDTIRKDFNGSLVSWISNLPGTKIEQDTLVHLPLIKFCDHQDYNYTEVPSYRPLMTLFKEGEPIKRDLNVWRTLPLDVRRDIRKAEGNYEHLIQLNESQRIGLAERGVLKKSIQNNQIVQEFDATQSESYSGHVSTSDIDNFLLQELSYVTNDYISIDVLEDLHIPDNSGFDPHDFISTLLNTDLFESISLLDLIIREVILSMKTNPTDKKRSNEFSFISKRVGRLNVILRTTRYSSTSDTPVHFIIACAEPFKPIHSLFEEVYKTGAIYHTKFVSLSRLRAEHYCNLTAQCLSLFAMIYDEIGPGLSPRGATLSDINKLIYPAKSLILTLLEDKEYTSRNLQQMRYYYMELIGTSRRHADKISGKLDRVCRSRLFLHFVKNICMTNDLNPDHVVTADNLVSDRNNLERTSFSGSDNSNDDPSETDMFLNDLISMEPNVNVTCFLRCRHSSLQTLLIPMYMSVLHNKNEMEKSLSAKQIVGKILQEEYKLDDSLHCTGDRNPSPNTSEYKSHDWSFNVVKRSAIMLRDELKTLAEEDLHSVAMRLMYQTTMDELATTKSSHSGICTTEVKTESDLGKIGVRNKCFVQVLESNPPSARLIDNVEYFRDRMVEENDCRLNVQMFKKNQIGGVREILILDFVSRCMIRLLEDMSRSMCKIHPYECLTKPQSKGSMTASHSFKVKSSRFSGLTMTWRASLDKTTWAQQFVNPTFYTILSTLLPDYSNFIAFVLDCHTRKRIEMPRDLVESFLKSKKSNLSDYEVGKLREEFLGFSPNVVTDGPFLPYINNSSNMMQGILHYTSSLLHTCYTVMLKRIMEMIVSKTGNTLIFTSQVSSDDSGILATILIKDESKTPESLSRYFDQSFQSAILSLDKCFSVRTSLHKSTMTFRPIYEFNSAFYSGNNYTNPLIKFVARVCDDNPSESLRSRVINMSNSLREVRSNGGSGALCSVLSVAQKLAYYMNLGAFSMDFFDKYIEPIMMYKLSHIGCFVSFPSLIAGIYGADFSDYYFCLNDRATHNMMSVLHRKPVIGGKLLSDLSGHYRAWPTDKYHRVMERLNIEPGFANSLSFDDLEFYFRPVMSWDDSKRRVELSVSNQSIARSFTFMSRCETVMSSAYLLWDKIFMHGEGSMALDELILSAINTTEEEGAVTLDRLFPNATDLSSVYSSLLCNVEYNTLPSRYIYRPHYYEPLHSGLNDLYIIKDVIASKWYGMIVKSSRTTVDLAFDSMREMLPWLSDDPEQTLKASGMSSPLELINYITMMAEKVKPIKLVSMGGTRKNRGVIENVCLLNNFRNKICFLRRPGDYTDNIDVPNVNRERGILIRQFQNRIADWSQLMLHFYPSENEEHLWAKIDGFCNSMTDDIKHLAVKYSRELRASLKVNSESRTAAEILSLVDPAVWRNEYVFNSDRSFDSHIGEYKTDNFGRHKNSTGFIRKRGNSIVVFYSNQGNVKSIITNSSEIDKRQLSIQYPHMDFSSSKLLLNREVVIRNPNCIRMHKAKLWLSNDEDPNRIHYLAPLMSVHGFFIEPLEVSHIDDLTAKIWCSRKTSKTALNDLLSDYPDVVDDLSTIAHGTLNIVSTSKIRAQFEHKEPEPELLDLTSFDDVDEMFSVLMGDYMVEESKHQVEAAPGVNMDFYSSFDFEAVNFESDMYTSSFRNETDIGYMSIHPLMTEIIRMISFDDLGRDGLHRVALNAAHQNGLISDDKYKRILNRLRGQDLISSIFR